MVVAEVEVLVAMHHDTRPGFVIDVFLESLMKDMAKVWEEGFKIWDEFAKEVFTLRGIIIVTINDYPALFSLSGQIKGKTMPCMLGEHFLFVFGRVKKNCVHKVPALVSWRAQVPLNEILQML